MPHPKDIELCAAASRGDRNAATAFVVRLRPHVRRLVSALVGGRDADRDDMVQDILVELLRNAQRYRGDGPLEGWARTIVIRQTMRRIRKRKREPSHGRDTPSDRSGGSVDGAARADLRHDLQGHLDGLSASLRQAFVLHYGLGRTILEIAALQRVSPNTVKSRLRLARENLRRAFEHSTPQKDPADERPTDRN